MRIILGEWRKNINLSIILLLRGKLEVENEMTKLGGKKLHIE